MTCGLRESDTVAKQSGLGDQLYIGSANVSGDIGSLSRIGGGIQTLDVTGIDKSANERVGGKRDGSIEFSSFYNSNGTTTIGAHGLIKTLPTADILVSYFRGSTIGQPAASVNAKQVDYQEKRAEDGALSFNVSAQGDAFGLEWGNMLTAGVRSDTTATNGTGFDWGAVGTPSTFGFQAYLHVFSFTGTSVTITLQDSADNVTYNAITGGAFAAVSAPGIQRIAAIPATIQRWTRVITAGTFSQVSFAVNFVRNESAVTF